MGLIRNQESERHRQQLAEKAKLTPHYQPNRLGLFLVEITRDGERVLEVKGLSAQAQAATLTGMLNDAYTHGLKDYEDVMELHLRGKEGDKIKQAIEMIFDYEVQDGSYTRGSEPAKPCPPLGKDTDRFFFLLNRAYQSGLKDMVQAQLAHTPPQEHDLDM